MKRREFVKSSVGAGLAIAALPSINSLGLGALARSRSLDAMRALAEDSDRVLVLVQLAGGNDGLNTLVPYDNPLYIEARPDLAMTRDNTLPLTDTLRWHGALQGMRDLYENEKLAIVQGVTYPNPNRSHFRGTDIWLTASDADVFLGTGWVGRYLESLFPEYPEVLPDFPMAIQIGGAISLGFQSGKGGTAIKFRNAQEFDELVKNKESGNYDDPPDTPAGDELSYVRTVTEASKLYSQRVIDAATAAGDNKAQYPDNNLARSLAVVAQLVAGGLQTKFYLVSIAGFDTHASQLGMHNTLLENVSQSIKAFMDDLEAYGVADRVAGMTFSEFGRRVAENGSFGTDHGTSAPLFVFGNKVIGKRIHGVDPSLDPDDLDSRGDLAMQHDFRQVYASALAQWFGEPETQIQQLLFDEFNTLPLFEAPVSSSVNSDTAAPAAVTNYPNPFRTETTIEYTLRAPAYINIEVMDLRGTILYRLVAEQQMPGTHRIPFRANGLPAGNYFYRFRADRFTTLKKLQVLR